MAELHTPRSLIVTLYGAYGRETSGSLAVAELIRLLAAVGVDAPSVRSSVSRLKRRGLLVAQPTAAGRGRLRPVGRRAPAPGRRRPAHLRPPLAPGVGRLGARGVLRPRVGAQQAARAALAPGRTRLRHGRAGRVARSRPGCTTRPGTPWNASNSPRTSTCSGASTSASRPPRRPSPAGGTCLPSPSSTRTSSTGTNRCCGPGSRGTTRAPAPGARPRPPTGTTSSPWTPGAGCPYADPGLPADLLPRDWPGARSAEVFGRLHAAAAGGGRRVRAGASVTVTSARRRCARRRCQSGPRGRPASVDQLRRRRAVSSG